LGKKRGLSGLSDFQTRKGGPMKPDNLKVKILGIVGTPIKDGNCQYLLEQALHVAESVGRVSTELVHLEDYRIEYCIGCEKCLRKVHKFQKEVGFDVIPVPIRDTTAA
jgi:multimeric flavodoxin WrbA